MTTDLDDNDPNKPTWRKPVGVLFLLLLILIWCIIAVSLIDQISTLNFWLQLPVYIFAGIAWIFPIKPLLLWMNTGKFRHPPVSGNGASDET